MLNVAIFLPLLTGLTVLALPRERADLVRQVALAGAVLTLDRFVETANQKHRAQTLQENVAVHKKPRLL